MFVFAQKEALFPPNLLKGKMFMVLSLVLFYTYLQQKPTVHFCHLCVSPDDDRIVSHDASRFVLYYHFECDVIIILQLARSEKSESSLWSASKQVKVPHLLLSKITS